VNWQSVKETTVTISNRLGLHARAAARLVRRASQFNSSVTLLHADTGESADGKSILSVLLLAASRGTSLIIKTEGDDEERAINALVDLVEQKFGEEISDGVF
jgi:phosphotransferase system HPr (HPr) family protein